MPFRIEFILPTGMTAVADIADDRLVLDENQDWVSPMQAAFVSVVSLPVTFSFATFESGDQQLSLDNVSVCKVFSVETVQNISTVFPGFKQIVDDSDGCQCMLLTCLGPRIYPVPVSIEEE